MNSAYHNSKPHVIKFTEFDLKCSILHFKLNKIIKFELMYMKMTRAFFESLEEIHLNYLEIKIFEFRTVSLKLFKSIINVSMYLVEE